MHRRGDVLHRVVDREAGTDGSPGGVYVEFDGSTGVFGFEEEELGRHQGRGLVHHLDIASVVVY